MRGWTTLRIAIIADIHGNLPAFEAVRQDLKQRSVDQIVNLGDLVFRGPCPEECYQLYQEMGAPMIRGNTEDWLTTVDSPLPEPLPAVRSWTRSRLSADALTDLANLPPTLQMQVAETTILFVHGSPRSNMEGLFPFSPEADLTAALQEISAEIVVCGHTHWAFHRRVAGRHLIGAGSIGLPFDGDRRASYAILDVVPGTCSVTHLRVAYDYDQTLRFASERGFPNQEFLQKTLGA